MTEKNASPTTPWYLNRRTILADTMSSADMLKKNLNHHRQTRDLQ